MRAAKRTSCSPISEHFLADMINNSDGRLLGLFSDLTILTINSRPRASYKEASRLFATYVGQSEVGRCCHGLHFSETDIRMHNLLTARV